MSLLQLPEELLLTICKYLNVKDKLNLYCTCSRLRTVATSQSVNKVCVLSLTTLATCNTFRLQYFREISPFLEELDLSGVQDLTKTNFMPCLKRMTNLKTLNVAYTNINIINMLDVKLGIENITINFDFPNKITEETLVSCQNYFKNFDSIHFVGDFNNLIKSQLPMYLLSKTRSNISLTFTALIHFKIQFFKTVDFEEPLTFQFLAINVPHWRYEKKFCRQRDHWKFAPILYQLNMNNFKYVIIAPKVYCSEEFKDFFLQKLNVKTDTLVSFANCASTNCLFLIWNNDFVTFDEAFFNELFLKVKDFFPNVIPCYANPVSRNSHTSWYSIDPSYMVHDTDDVLPAKLPRVAPSPIVLDFDSIFTEKERIKLSLNFTELSLTRIYKLSEHSNYLQKVTVLKLVGNNIMLTHDFYKILFQYCSNLVTLNVDIDSPPNPMCSSLISKYIHLSKTLKNFRFIAKLIDLKNLFQGFSKCESLENIHIIEATWSSKCNVDKEDIDSLLSHCAKLYSIYVEASFPDRTRNQLRKSFLKSKQKYKRHYLKAVFDSTDYKTAFSYDPYVSVFPVCEIKY